MYLDLSFFQELQTRFGAQGGPFAEAYVLAHEYGHHVQDLRGNLANIGRRPPGRRQRRRALRAAGRLPRRRLGAQRRQHRLPAKHVSDNDIAQALERRRPPSATTAIQRKQGGGVNPETWTHGSSQQRQQWFTTGYRDGRMETCDQLLPAG